MRYFFVYIDSSNGNIKECNEVTETQFNSAEPNPSVTFGKVLIPIGATNPKKAQKEASIKFSSMKERLKASY